MLLNQFYTLEGLWSSMDEVWVSVLLDDMNMFWHICFDTYIVFFLMINVFRANICLPRWSYQNIWKFILYFYYISDDYVCINYVCPHMSTQIVIWYANIVAIDVFCIFRDIAQLLKIYVCSGTKERSGISVLPKEKSIYIYSIFFDDSSSFIK